MEELQHRVDAALQRTMQVLGAERCAKFPAELPHAYEDKFAVVELATEAAIAGQQNVLCALFSGWPGHLPWLVEQAAGRAVSLRFAATERCTLERQEQRVLELPQVRRTGSWLQESVEASLLALVGQPQRRIREDVWRVSVTWRISAVAGSDPADSADVRVLEKGQGWREIKVVCDPSAASAAPRPSVTVVPPEEVDLSWLLRHLAGPSPHFRIDRSAESCRTPSRNEDIVAAFRHFTGVQRWTADVRAWLQDALLSGMVMPQGSLNRIERVSQPIEFVDTDGDTNRLAMDGLQLIWYEPGSGGWQPWARGPFSFDLSTGELKGELIRGEGIGRAVLPEVAGERLLRCVFGGSLGIQQADLTAGCGGRALALVLAVFALERGNAPGACTFSAEDLGHLAAEHARNIAEGLAALEEAYPEAGGQLPAARLAACLRLLAELSEQHLRSVDAVEGMLRKQLLAALGKEVGPSDFDELMCWHQRRALRDGFRPRAFSYPIQQPGMSAEGHLALEARPGEELRSFVSWRPALRSMKLPINASVNVSFKGDRFLHGAAVSCFAEQPQQMTLEARVRQFGCVVLVLGTIASVDSFSPTAALILRGDESLRIPLLLEALPTAKEFRDATVSLSPEQRRFAEAIRAMQLASTVFGVCVIPVKPQLERLLGLPQGSLTQEVKLTQDIIELLIKYHIPSSLICYGGDPEADKEAKLAAIRADVGGLRAMIDEERRRELEDQRRRRELEEQRRRRELEEQWRLQRHQQRLRENAMLERDAGRLFEAASAPLCARGSSSSRSSGGFFANLFGGSGFSNFSSVKYSAVSNEATSLDFAMPTAGMSELMDRGETLEALVTKSEDLSASCRKFKRLAGSGARDRDRDRVAKAVVQDAAVTTKQRKEAAQGAPEGQQAAHRSKAPEAATQCDPDPAPAEEATPDHSLQPEQQAGSIEEPEALDYTSIPAALDARCNELGGGAALRPVIIKAGSKWSRRSKNLVGIPKDTTLGADQQREERNSAFDLLDALTCSGSLTVDIASLHVVLLVAHCFEKALLDMLVQENVNPLDPVERSSLILASTIHGNSVQQLLQPAELPRVSQHSPALVAPGPAEE